MRHLAIEQRARDAERGIGIEHRAEGGDRRGAMRCQEIRHRGGERSRGRAKRADQAVAREDLRPALVGRVLRQHGMLQRHEHAEIAAGRIDGADEGDQRDQEKMLDIRECQSRRRHQARAEDQQRAQIVPRRDPADPQRKCGRAEQRRGGHQADRGGVIAERGHVGRQHDDGKAVAEAAQAPRRIQQRDQGGIDGSSGIGCRRSWPVFVHAQSLDGSSVAQSLNGRAA